MIFLAAKSPLRECSLVSLRDHGLQQSTSRKAESSKCIHFVWMRLQKDPQTGILPWKVQMIRICTFSPLKKSGHVAIEQPKSSNVLVVLLFLKTLLNCSTSFIFLCYYQSNLSRRDIINSTASSQNKYQYVEPAVGETKTNLVSAEFWLKQESSRARGKLTLVANAMDFFLFWI